MHRSPNVLKEDFLEIEIADDRLLYPIHQTRNR
jgi:hypothetical protein